MVSVCRDEENVEMEVDQNDIQDLCRLDHLTQDVIIDCLRKRFENEKFYVSRFHTKRAFFAICGQRRP